jgi:O-antigen/teichoic acid export membrane protein
MAETLKEKTAKGLFWGGVSNGVQQVLNLVFGIFLARMLSQSDYGMVGMLTIFSAVAGSLQEGGFISALNRKKNVTHKDYNAVFWFNISVGFLLYLILFFCAPLIARFYGIPELTPLARFIFIGLFISSLGIVPSAIMYRNLMVKESAICSFVTLIVSGSLGVMLAANGFAYWGIAIQTVVHVFMSLLLRLYFVKWHPSLKIDFSPIKEMIGFSCKLIATNIFNTINGNIFPIILGKLYSAREVGNYTQANKWNNMGSTLVGSMVGSVAQPVFAKVDDDVMRQKRVFRKLLRFTAFVSFPAMFGLALVAKEFIVILLTEKWLESALMMQMLCVAGAFAPVSSLFSNLIVARGHSTTFMWCTISLCLAQLAAAFLSVPYGIDTMIMVYVAINICWILVWHHYAHKEISLNLFEVIKDISPYLLLATAFVCLAVFLTKDIANLYLSFIVKVLTVSILYALSLWLLKSAIFKEFILFVTKRHINEE